MCRDSFPTSSVRGKGLLVVARHGAFLVIVLILWPERGAHGHEHEPHFQPVARVKKSRQHVYTAM